MRAKSSQIWDQFSSGANELQETDVKLVYRVCLFLGGVVSSEVNFTKVHGNLDNYLRSFSQFILFWNLLLILH